MTLYEFKQLDEMKQIETIWNSTHIASRRDEEHNVLLYQIDGFYAEVYHHKEENTVKKIRTFVNVDCLEPYLSDITIEGIFKKS